MRQDPIIQPKYPEFCIQQGAASNCCKVLQIPHTMFANYNFNVENPLYCTLAYKQINTFFNHII